MKELSCISRAVSDDAALIYQKAQVLGIKSNLYTLDNPETELSELIKSLEENEDVGGIYVAGQLNPYVGPKTILPTSPTAPSQIRDYHPDVRSILEIIGVGAPVKTVVLLGEDPHRIAEAITTFDKYTVVSIPSKIEPKKISNFILQADCVIITEPIVTVNINYFIKKNKNQIWVNLFQDSSSIFESSIPKHVNFHDFNSINQNFMLSLLKSYIEKETHI